MSEKRSEPHTLVIEEVFEDGTFRDGEPRWQYEWHVEHPNSCSKEVVADEGFGGETISWDHYTCLVEYELDNVGLDGLTDMGRQRIEPGEHKIVGWAAHYPSTPVSGEEWDSGLEIIEG